jgi:hypothetical protein
MTNKIGVIVRRLSITDVEMGSILCDAIHQFQWQINAPEIVELSEYKQDQIYAKVLTDVDVYLLTQDFAEKQVYPILKEQGAGRVLSHFMGSYSPAIFVDVDFELPKAAKENVQTPFTIGSLRGLRNDLQVILSHGLDANLPIELVFFLKDMIFATELAIQNQAYLIFGTIQHPVFRQSFTNVWEITGEVGWTEENY